MKNNELKAANSLNSLSEQGRNSPYNIKKISSRQLMRKKKHKLGDSYLTQILQKVNMIRIVRQTVAMENYS